MKKVSKLFLALPLCFALAQSAYAGTAHESNPVAPAKQATTQEAAAPVESVAATESGYTLRAGDLLQITVWKEDEMDREVLVLPDGTIDFPLVGSFTAAGLTPASLQTVIKQKLKGYIPSASVTVVVKETRGNVVSVIGQVTKPGDVVMNRNITVMQALSQAGGLTAYADEDDIVILRKVDGKETSIPFDYSRIANGRHLESNITLNPGDVVVVPTASLF